MTGKITGSLPPEVLKIGRAVRNAGGRAIVVGGYVRDRLIGLESKDIDVEVFGLSLEELEAVLGKFGEIQSVGRAFGVLQVKDLPVDFSLPRKDSKAAPGHRGFEITVDPSLSFKEASRRRDLTMNSMGLDIATGEILDPHGGQRDLAGKILRATDARYFPEDPLRGLRVAQFAARFLMAPDSELLKLCTDLNLSELPAERLFEEFSKMLIKGEKPSVGFEFLRKTELLRFFPEMAGLVGLDQDPVKHPEGDVWTHTLMVVDEASLLRDGRGSDEALMFAALCHDFGKQTTTEQNAQIRSLGHEIEGAKLAENFLKRLRASAELVRAVGVLVRYHMAPTLLAGGAKPAAYRRLSRKLDEAGIRMETLARLARADRLGRETPEAKQRKYPEGDRFMNMAMKLGIQKHAPRDAVMGRHLIARGLEPGPDFSKILELCREIQDETGWDNPEKILDTVMGSRGKAPTN